MELWFEMIMWYQIFNQTLQGQVLILLVYYWNDIEIKEQRCTYALLETRCWMWTMERAKEETQMNYKFKRVIGKFFQKF